MMLQLYKSQESINQQ